MAPFTRISSQQEQSELWFQILLETLPHNAFLIGADGETILYNQRLVDYLGFRPGRTAADRAALLHPDDRQQNEDARIAGLANRQEYTTEARFLRHDGVYRWHRIHNVPLLRDEEAAGWIGTAVDIHEMRDANALLERRVQTRTAALEAENARLRAEVARLELAGKQTSLLQRIEDAGKIAGTVAHDFNNLLTAILGSLELLGTDLAVDPNRRQRMLATARSAVDRGVKLTGQFLAFARKAHLDAEPTDLNRMVASLLRALGGSPDEPFELRFIPGKTVWPAMADPAQIEPLLLNLITNAREAMPHGPITLATEAVHRGPPQAPEEPPEGDYVALSVSDTGPGMEEDVRTRIFEPFFTTKRSGRGAGLGLPQVLAIVKQLNGGMEVRSSAGSGTTVTLFLPRARVAVDQEAEMRTDTTASLRPAKSERAERIVLVDDDPDVRVIAADMLRDAGYEVTEAESGPAALDVLESEGRPAMMVVDVAMPVMTGVELATIIGRNYPDLPVVFMTGYAAVSLLPALARQEVLRKPFLADDLSRTVSRVLAKSRASRRAC